jgi:hypothetical protein
VKETTEKETKYNLWNPPPRDERKMLFANLTPKEIAEAIQNIDWDEVNMDLEERLAHYTGNSAIWCRTPWGGFWRRC